MHTTRSLRPLSLLLALATSVATPSLAAQDPQGGGAFGNRVLSETTFAGWTGLAHLPLVNFGGGLSTFGVNACGNPAPGMQVNCAPPAGATAGRVLLSAATWDPSLDCCCPVTDIRMELDHKNGVTGAPGQLVRPAVVQGGTLYVGPPLAAFSVPWAKLIWPNLAATAFLNVTGATAGGLTLGLLNPDFTCGSGTTLSFGFVATVSSAIAVNRTHCYDNFKVVLNCPATFTTFCTGCPNCGVLPPTIGYAGGLPVVPNPFFQITETGACPSVPTFLILGLSDTISSMGALPLNLAFIGYPACNLCVSPDAIVAAFTTGTGTAAVTLPIPNDEYLIGARFYAQWIDFGPPPIGMSNAAKIVIGK